MARPRGGSGSLDYVTNYGKALEIMTFSGSPTYSVKFYKEGLYKLVKFKSPRGCCVRDREDDSVPVALSPDEQKKVDEQEARKRFLSSISRSRSMIYQLAICNPWDYFFTCTIDKKKMDRYDRFGFMSRLAQWLRDQRKKPGYESLAYLLIPEQHKDGAWHVHGLMRGLPESALSYFVPFVHPRDLVEGGFRNWEDCSVKFGYCSLGRIRSIDRVSGYVVKYVTKDMASGNQEVGNHLYYASWGLRRAVHFLDIFGSYRQLDRYLEKDFQYCSLGYVRNVKWSFWLDYMDFSDLVPLFPSDSSVSDEGTYHQFILAGFPGRKDDYIAEWCSGNIPVLCSGAAGSIPASAPNA